MHHLYGVVAECDISGGCVLEDSVVCGGVWCEVPGASAAFQ